MTSPRSVPLLDVSRMNVPLREEIFDAVGRVYDSGRFLYGPDVVELENEVARMCRVNHAVGCASGSDALLLALMANGIGQGDEVIVPSFTFFSTASAVWRVGAKIVFVDIDPGTFNIDPSAVEAAVTPATRAVIPVHLFGQCADMLTLREIAGKHDLLLIEDAAQAIGARFLDRPAGSWGDIGCFSFYPTKNLGGCGDGGMLTCDDGELAESLRLYASHGMKPRYFHKVVGINSRLDSIQAAMLRVKLGQLVSCTEHRRKNAARYEELFAAAGLDNEIGLPVASPGAHHVWNQYSIRVADGQRQAMREHLTSCGIGTEIYYPHPLHLQECFASCGYGPGSLPETERAAEEVLALPIFPGLTSVEQHAVVSGIKDFFAGRQASAA